MNVKTTIALVVLLAIGLGGILLLYTDWGEQKPQAQPAEKKLLADLGKVVRLEVQTPRESKGRMVLVSKDDKWRLAEPVDAPATTWEVSSIVTTLTNLKYVRKYGPKDKDRPKADITSLPNDPLKIATLTDEDDKSYTILIGKKVPFSTSQTYVQVKGDEHLYVVEADLAEELKKTAADLRDKNVVDFQTDQAIRVTVRGEQNYQLVKVDDKWAIDRPVSARADQDRVRTLLNDIVAIYAEKFIDEPKELTGYGLDKPRATVTVELAPPKPTTQATQASKPAKGRVITITFGTVADKKEQTIFAKLADQPWVFLVKESRLKDVQPKLLDLRDKKVLDIGSAEVTRIEAAFAEGKTLALQKADEKWTMRKPFAGPCDAEAVKGLVDALRELKATDFQDNPASFAAYQLDPPRGKIVLHLRGKEQAAVLLLGGTTKSGEMAFVRAGTAKSVAVIPSEDFAKLLRGPEAYWTRQFLKLPENAEITEVTLARPRLRIVLERQKDGKFRLTAPIAAPADEDNVKDLIEALKDVKADKIVSLDKTLPKRFAKAKPQQVSLTYRVPIPTKPPTTKPTTTATAPATSTAPTTAATSAKAPAPASKPTTTSAPTTATAPAVKYETRKAGPLLVVKDKNHAYIWKPGTRPVAVGELGEDFYDKLNAEVRDRQVLKIDHEKVVAFSLAGGKKPARVFKKVGEEWQFTADRHVRLDPEKIKDFLKELDFKAKRFVEYTATAKADLRRYALDAPADVLEITDSAGKTLTLRVSRTGPVDTEDRYATSSEVPGVFVLSADDVKKIQKKLRDFQKQE